MGVDGADADRADEGEFVMVRDWGKMPYPKFMETSRAALVLGGEVLWSGMCYFAYKARVAVEKDGIIQSVDARLTTETDLSAFMCQANNPAAYVEVWHGGTRKTFGIVTALPAYNPDGSFHHITFSLLERATGGDDDAAD